MAEQFYMILTDLGLAEVAAAVSSSGTVTLNNFSVGDSNGSYYTPTAGQTALVNQLYLAGLNSVSIDGGNPNWLVAEGVIPADHSAQVATGFTVREIGIWSDSGNLFAIGKFPETYKPLVTDGSSKDLYVKTIMEFSNASVVTLNVDPNVVVATKAYVDDSFDPILQPDINVLRKAGPTGAEELWYEYANTDDMSISKNAYFDTPSWKAKYAWTDDTLRPMQLIFENDSTLSIQRATAATGSANDVIVWETTTLNANISDDTFTDINVSGVANFADGTELLPSITFTNDPDTGIYRAAINTVGIVANGADSVRISDTMMTVYTSAQLSGGGNFSIADGGVLKLSDGTASNPGFEFINDPNTGIFRASADEMGLVTGGVERIRIDSSGYVGIGISSPNDKLEVYGGNILLGSNNQFLYGVNTGASVRKLIGLNASNRVEIAGDGQDIVTGSRISVTDGSVLFPAYSFVNDTTTGIYQPAAGYLSIVCSGAITAHFGTTYIEPQVPIWLQNGSAAGPSYSFASDSTTGIYRVSSETIGFACGANQIANIYPNGIRLIDGSVVAPGYSFINDPNTGIYRSAADQIGFACGGVHKLTISSSGISVNAGFCGATNFIAGDVSTVGLSNGSDLSAGYLAMSVGGGGGTMQRFYTTSGEAGSISTSGSTTAFNTSSARELKTVIGKIDNALDIVNNWKPYVGSFKSDPDNITRFFIADEMIESCPNSVIGEGKSMQMAYGSAEIITALTAAIQHLSAKINVLEDRLDGNN